MAAPPEFSPATQADCLKLLEMALREDMGHPNLRQGVDCTTAALVPDDARAVAAFVSRQSGVVCGIATTRLAISTYAPELELDVNFQDGQRITAGETIAELSGWAREILMIERTCLNFMCRLSGISSLTRSFVDQVTGTSAKVLDTRKTTPGWRRLEKFAVACGGGFNHRMGLYDAIMIKDNHLAFYRSRVASAENVIPEAVRAARAWIEQHAADLPHGRQTVLQLEVDSLTQLERALTTDCDIVLLDNMAIDQLKSAVELRDRLAPGIELEASGGVNLTTVAGIAATGVDRISVGGMTHSAVNFDIGLDWR